MKKRRSTWKEVNRRHATICMSRFHVSKLDAVRLDWYVLADCPPNYSVPACDYYVIIGRWNVTVRLNNRVVAQWSVLCIM